MTSKMEVLENEVFALRKDVVTLKDSVKVLASQLGLDIDFEVLWLNKKKNKTNNHKVKVAPTI